MAMSLIWTAMVGAAILCGLATGNGPAVARGAPVSYTHLRAHETF